MTDISTKKSKAPPPLGKEFDDFLQDLSGETDRAAVILGTAKLDLLLYELLQRVLLPSPGPSDELLDSESSVGSYSSRINLAYRLGLIDSELARALHMIRKIRNSFAHEISTKNLSAGAHADRIRELVAPIKKYHAYDNLKTKFKEKEGSAADFRVMCGIVASRLERARDSAQPFTNKNAQPLIPEWWTKKS